MGSYCSEAGYSDSNPNPKPKRSKKKDQRRAQDTAERGWNGKAWPRRGRPPGAVGGGAGVTLEGYVEVAEGSDLGSDGGDGVGRTKSLTDDDLEELKGCLDLGFGFSYDEIPELRSKLPALELCYSMRRSFMAGGAGNAAVASLPIANWKISSPGDHPDEVKARLKLWAQAVACTVRLCS